METARHRLLVHSAWLYHVDRLTQEEVAERLSVSRSTISRALRQAEEEGIVEIRVTEPLPEAAALEHGLLSDFSLATATVALPTPAQTPMSAAARAAARVVEDLVARGPGTVAVGWGRTLREMLPHIRKRATRGVTIVDAVGHSPWREGAPAVEVARALGRAFAADVVHIPAPAYVPSAAMARTLLQSEAVADALQAARRADATVVSIGAMTPDSPLVTNRILTVEDMRRLVGRGAVGDILGHFIDAEGRPLAFEERLPIGLSLQDLQAAKLVLAVAAGLEKVPAIRAAARAGLVKGLVTERETAEALLSLP
ncbi:MAG: helix-turn-helix domain-containing protein [Actinomycetota bacterium]|nr:helix-turn-helix domain-containing protein [Actinomycetota bacterium]